MIDQIIESARQAIVNGDADAAVAAARWGLEQNVPGLELLNRGFIPGINEVGEKFGEGELFLPELIMSANAMQAVIQAINASLGEGARRVAGKVIIGAVEGDLHDIGKTIVVSMLKANGFDVLDLGRDVPVDRFIAEAEAFNADVIGTSALLTTTMTVQKELEDRLRENGLKGRFKTIVGGAPVTRRWAERIGADAYAADAADAVRQIKRLLGQD